MHRFRKQSQQLNPARFLNLEAVQR